MVSSKDLEVMIFVFDTELIKHIDVDIIGLQLFVIACPFSSFSDIYLLSSGIQTD